MCAHHTLPQPLGRRRTTTAARRPFRNLRCCSKRSGMTYRSAAKQKLSRAIFMLVAILASLIVAQTSVVRAQTSGNLAQIEMQLTPFLAAGGTLEDLCDTGENHIPSCPECDICCLQSQGIPAETLSLIDVWHRLVSTEGSTPEADVFLQPRSPPGPPVRAPPVHI